MGGEFLEYVNSSVTGEENRLDHETTILEAVTFEAASIRGI